MNDVNDTLNVIKEIFNIYKAKNVNPERMIYVTPYSPTKLEIKGLARSGKDLPSLYFHYVSEA